MKRVSSAWVVDDDPTDVYLATYFLTASERFGAICASRDGADLLDRLQNPELAREMCPGEFPPRVIFLDIDMPCMSGFDVLNELEQHGPQLDQTKVILLTASDNPQYRRRAADSPLVAQFMEKPLDRQMAEQVAESFGSEVDPDR